MYVYIYLYIHKRDTLLPELSLMTHVYEFFVLQYRNFIERLFHYLYSYMTLF